MGPHQTLVTTKNCKRQAYRPSMHAAIQTRFRFHQLTQIDQLAPFIEYEALNIV